MKNYLLSNGIRVVVERIPTLRSVSFGVWVKIGSRHESPQNNGITHLIEHMLFKGTDRRSSEDIAKVFDGIGGQVNAFTSKEYTCYYAKVLDTHLPIALDVLSDMLLNSTIAEDELAREKNVVYEEIAMYDDTPDDKVHDLVVEAAYGAHPLAYSILGTEQTLATFDSAALKQYIAEYYTVGQTVISVAGNVDETELLQLLEHYFAGPQSKQRAGEAPKEAPPEFKPTTLFHKKQTEQNHICLSFPGVPIGDRYTYAAALLNNALGGGMSSRLFQEIREKRGMAYSIYSYHSSHADSGLTTIYMGTAAKQTQGVLELTLDLLSELKQKGLSEEEVVRGKEHLKGSLILGLESTSSRMNRLGKNELMTGKHLTLDELLQKVDDVTAEDITAVTELMLSSQAAVSMVGVNDKPLKKLGGNEFVSSIV